MTRATSATPTDIEATQDHACTVVGVGLRTHAQPAALQALWVQALWVQALWMQAQGLLQGQSALTPSTLNPCVVAVLDTKADHPALAAWLSGMAGTAPTARAVPVLPVPAARMAGQPVATHSPRLQTRYGTGSVAEAAALSAAGPQSELAVPRLVAADGSATLAVAIRRAGHPDCCVAATALVRAAAPSQELLGASV